METLSTKHQCQVIMKDPEKTLHVRVSNFTCILAHCHDKVGLLRSPKLRYIHTKENVHSILAKKTLAKTYVYVKIRVHISHPCTLQ